MVLRPVITGQPPTLLQGERGLVIPPLELLSITKLGGDPADREIKYRLSRIPQDDELRRALFFWDKIDFPVNNNDYVLNGDFAFLQSTGILYRSPQPIAYVPDMRTYGTPQFQQVMDYREEMVLALNAAVYRSHEERQPGQWAMGVTAGSVKLAKDQQEAGRGLLVRLHGVVPVPDGEAPFADILEFKLRRKAELTALRMELEGFYLDIIASPDKPIAEQFYFSRMDRALADLMMAAKEAPFRIQPASLEATVNAQAIGAGFVVAAAAASTGMPLAGSAIAGITATAIASIKTTIGIKQQDGKTNPFRYIISMRREF
jgi:hypothetical protein